MKSLLALSAALAFTVVLGACQKGEANENTPSKTEGPVTNVTTDYTKDVENICEAVKRSGADKEEPDARQLIIANWLAANLKTADSRKFLVHIQPMVGDAKAQALDDEAKRLGLPGCTLSADWRKPK